MATRDTSFLGTLYDRLASIGAEEWANLISDAHLAGDVDLMYLLMRNAAEEITAVVPTLLDVANACQLGATALSIQDSAWSASLSDTCIDMCKAACKGETK